MKKTLIYPFSHDFLTIIEHSDKMENIDIDSLVSPLGWGLCNEEYLLNKKIIRVTNDFDSNIEKCSIVWFTNSTHDLDLERFIIPKIKTCIEQNKRIIYTRNDIKELEKYLPEYQLEKIENRHIVENYIEPETSLNQITTPVVFICDIYGGLDTFNLLLKVDKELYKRGYSTMKVTYKKEGYLMGSIPVPNYITDENIPSRSRIIRFNNFIKNNEVKYKPDLIIIEVPGELFGLSKKVFLDFGIKAYEISNAIQNDCGILCMPAGAYVPEYFEELKQLISIKFGINIDYLNLENKDIDNSESEFEQKASYIPMIDNSYIESVIDNEKTFCISENDNTEVLVDNIINQLKSYMKVNSI